MYIQFKPLGALVGLEKKYYYNILVLFDQLIK